MLVHGYLSLYLKAPPCTADPFCQMKGSALTPDPLG